MTAGYVHDVRRDRFGRIGIGGDVTTYRMQRDLYSYFLGSRSFHVFVRWRPGTPTMHVH